MQRLLLPMTCRLLLTVTLAAVTAACSTQAKVCEQCGRAECRNLSFDVRHQDGTVVQTCCPRCALHYLAGAHPPVASLAVRDFDTAGRIDATLAFYVEGSEVAPCTASAGSPPRDERGCCMKTVYDRCLPSLLAFGSSAKAETFARQHGGTIRTFADLQSEIH
ncbi:MAG: nitrous oxide reductase accessory protein NosL [Acidobacteriia bacterium]|nr:nitrous oxide reductase accessory protein NosL [Terriglobia bacterium]